jgi:hypothetical protein
MRSTTFLPLASLDRRGDGEKKKKLFSRFIFKDFSSFFTVLADSCARGIEASHGLDKIREEMKKLLCSRS